MSAYRVAFNVGHVEGVCQILCNAGLATSCWAGNQPDVRVGAGLPGDGCRMRLRLARCAVGDGLDIESSGRGWLLARYCTCGIEGHHLVEGQRGWIC